MSIQFAIPFVLAVTAFLLVHRRCHESVRMPWLTFALSYGLTTAVGAIILGFSGGDPVWKIFDPTLDSSFIRKLDTWKYWLLLFSPFFVAALPLLARPRYAGSSSGFLSRLERTKITLLSFWTTLLLLSAYAGYWLAQDGSLGNIVRSFQLSGDYQTLIAERTRILLTLPADFSGILYVGFPALAAAALYQWLQEGSSKWAFALTATAVLDVYFILCTYQKGPIFILLVSLALGYAALRKVRWMHVAAAVGGGGLLLIVLQFIFLGELSAAASLPQIIFRMADSFPFYVSLYPNVIPHSGMNYGLGLLGWGVIQLDNLQVFDYMYPSVQWVQGRAAAPAHIRAFAQGGYPWMLLVLVLIGIGIRFTAMLRRKVNGPLTFSFFIQALVALYYVTQTSVRGALLESTGVVYGVFAIALLWGISQFLDAALRPARSALLAADSTTRTAL
jgi:hypothetical protein